MTDGACPAQAHTDHSTAATRAGAPRSAELR